MAADRSQKKTIVEQVIKVLPNEKYLISGFAKVDYGPLNPRIEVLDVATGKVLSVFEGPGSLAQTGWVSLGGIFKSPNKMVLLRLVARHFNLRDTLGNTIDRPLAMVDETSIKKWRYYFDNIKITKVPESSMEEPFRENLKTSICVIIYYLSFWFNTTFLLYQVCTMYNAV